MKMLLFVEIPVEQLLLRTLERTHTHPHRHTRSHYFRHSGNNFKINTIQ